jgi:hypothetical protein
MQPNGNTRLVAYGIQNEQSDIRAHVSMLASRVYVYSTDAGRQAAESGQYPNKPAFTSGIITARGYVIPPRAIPGCKAIDIPDRYHGYIREADSTSDKGAKAVEIVSCLLRAGTFPISVAPIVITDEDLQIQGTDIMVRAHACIQVKCDFKAGCRDHGGTGNLFIQIAECNPFKRY